MGQAGPQAEAERVERARGGDAEAFRALCAHYEAAIQARLRRVVTVPLQRKVSLADVMQEAYVTAHQRLDEFEHRGDGAFGAWLTRIAELKPREAIRRYVGAEKRDVHRERSRGMRPDTARFTGTLDERHVIGRHIRFQAAQVVQRRIPIPQRYGAHQS